MFLKILEQFKLSVVSEKEREREGARGEKKLVHGRPDGC